MTRIKPIITERHPRDKLLRTERLPHIWCPGCGLGKVLGAYGEAVLKSGIPVDKHAVISGIGCTGRSAGYLNVDSYHTTHGRPIAFATGLKVARPDMEVTVISGDGDLATIGGNHIIHAARRNVNITVIMVNNFNYGMTGGQASATTPHHAKTTTTRYGNYEYPFNMPFLMRAAGATYIARWTALHIKQITDSILKSFENKGFSFIEVMSPCPKGFGKKNKFREGIHQLRYFEEHSYLGDKHDLTDHAPSMHPDEDLPIGEFFADGGRIDFLSNQWKIFHKDEKQG